jgi:DNA-binding transcriptional ArsR family regulator
LKYGNKPRSPGLAALAQETRLAIFRLLVEAGPTGLAAGEIAATVGVAPPTSPST